ncbi:hypothetical protein M427DRAFT_494984 [Gonapodya prolifera JEL478]|uniref:Uncharacterized protein n=1 Tax=Gonapodya prolifera (strain JEL478) TaxID=1344416 RepID=A0A139AI28_GONPJ|nr:hypothetical protein M427DRAFT_494984 [Gonapodya prolifera JEL478]|eukprot:KXS16481.1 hypothetical protein M427DRAFT_494984 [Gonapodya prolifera JEL478]
MDLSDDYEYLDACSSDGSDFQFLDEFTFDIESFGSSILVPDECQERALTAFDVFEEEALLLFEDIEATNRKEEEESDPPLRIDRTSTFSTGVDGLVRQRAPDITENDLDPISRPNARSVGKLRFGVASNKSRVWNENRFSTCCRICNPPESRKAKGRVKKWRRRIWVETIWEQDVDKGVIGRTNGYW